MHLDGSKAGVSVQSSRHHIFADGQRCEEISAEMGATATATAAVWIRAMMIVCSGMDRKFGAGESQQHGDAPQRRAVRMVKHGLCGSFDQGVIMGGYYLLLDGERLDGEKKKILELTLRTLRFPISPLTEWLGLFLRR